MRKIAYTILIFLSACSKPQLIKVIPENVEKPALEFSREQLIEPQIITNDKCYLLNSPKTDIICMLPSEFEKEINNYRIMLDIIKQYQISDKYYREIK